MSGEREHFELHQHSRRLGDPQDVVKKNLQAVCFCDSTIHLAIVLLSFRTNLQPFVSFDAHVSYFCYSKLLLTSRLSTSIATFDLSDFQPIHSYCYFSLLHFAST
ncbi:hypothetical protein DPSP01_006757 [Paraphaeosphaeria sporulosa]